MKAAGVVAEFNPLHKGHIYHLRKTAELSGCDAVVVAMSGDFVQRGMPAVFDKWTRAGHALRCGADLVIEIPAVHCLADAGVYAGAGVRLLEATGKVSHISFGSECGDREVLKSTADFIRNNAEALKEGIINLRKDGLSYPAAREKTYRELGGPVFGPEILGSPNDILGIEYILAMENAQPLVIKRQGAGYHMSGTEVSDGGYMSAGGIREMMRKSDDISSHVPECVLESVKKRFTDGESIRSCEMRLFDLVRFAVLSMDAGLIDECPSGGEGLGNLVKEKVLSAGDMTELITTVKSKRYTYTRISRLCMQAMLGIKRDGISSPGYIRVLGFNDRGRELLSEIRKGDAASLPVITNINKESHMLDDKARRMLETDIHAADIYNLITGENMSKRSDHRQMPCIVTQ